MGTSMPVRSLVGRRRSRANDRWKERWGTWLARSTVAAVGAHLVLLVAFPGWEIFHREAPVRSEVIQLRPIASYDPLTDPGEGALGERPGLERTELALENESPDGLEVESGDVTEAAGGPVPSVAYPVMATRSEGPAPASLRQSRMILEPMARVRPDLAPMGPAVSWPLIRNPTAILRFLKNRYNPVHSPSIHNRFVSVAMGINERGSVEWTEVRESSGHPIVDEIALTVFNEVVVFAPARSEGAPIAVSVVISIPFDMPW